MKVTGATVRLCGPPYTKLPSEDDSTRCSTPREKTWDRRTRQFTRFKGNLYPGSREPTQGHGHIRGLTVLSTERTSMGTV